MKRKIIPHHQSTEKERFQARLKGPMTCFSATCSRLSQYLKEQKNLAATANRRTTSLIPNLLAEAEGETSRFNSKLQPMNLFPQHAGFGTAATEEEKATLTIFYGGQMLVFDDFPADKAKDLILMAGELGSVDPPTPVPAVAALPLMRRASLHRFMEKRTERIHSSKMRYEANRSQSAATANSTKQPVGGLPRFLPAPQPDSS